MENKWLKYPDDLSSYAQRRTIRKMLDYLGLSEKWLYDGIKKQLNVLTMKEADQVIKKLSQIKKK